MNIPNSIEVIRIAKEQAPKEMCGLLVEIEDKEVFWPCTNLYEDIDGFFMDPKDFAEAEDQGTILAIVHSHINRNTDPTDADLAGISSSGLQWFIINPFTWTITEIPYVDNS